MGIIGHLVCLHWKHLLNTGEHRYVPIIHYGLHQGVTLVWYDEVRGVKKHLLHLMKNMNILFLSLCLPYLE